jgi:hypothetical protein
MEGNLHERKEVAWQPRLAYLTACRIVHAYPILYPVLDWDKNVIFDIFSGQLDLHY